MTFSQRKVKIHRDFMSLLLPLAHSLPRLSCGTCCSCYFPFFLISSPTIRSGAFYFRCSVKHSSFRNFALLVFSFWGMRRLIKYGIIRGSAKMCSLNTKIICTELRQEFIIGGFTQGYCYFSPASSWNIWGFQQCLSGFFFDFRFHTSSFPECY